MADSPDHFLLNGRLQPVGALDLAARHDGVPSAVVESRIDDLYVMLVHPGEYAIQVDIAPPGEPALAAFHVTVSRPAVRYGSMGEATINWASLGSSHPRIADAMGEALALAAAIARRLADEAGL